MNLIKQLGGYEKAKKELNSPSNTNVFFQCEIEQALLEYRRQHNIFEVGDKVLYADAEIYQDEVYTILEFLDGGEAVLDDGDCCDPVILIHATPEEIKAGKRLEVNDAS